jgi:hypothetical protein
MRNDLGKILNTGPRQILIVRTAHVIPPAIRRTKTKHH